MKPVSCPEKNCGGEISKASCGRGQQLFIYRLPLPQTACTIALELVAKEIEAAGIHHTLTKLSVKHGEYFSLADEEATNFGVRFGKGDDARTVRLG